MLGFAVKHPFMCFFGCCFDARFRSEPLTLVGSGLEWISRVGKPSCVWWWAGSLGKLPSGSVGSFVPPSQAFVLRNGGRNGRARWGLSAKRWPFFFLFLNQAGWLEKGFLIGRECILILHISVFSKAATLLTL